jgi:filamentous hemagglutinin family protein
MLSSLLAVATMLAVPARLLANGNGAFVGTPSSGPDFSVNRGLNTDTITVTSPTAVIDWTPADSASTGGAIDFLPSGNSVTYISHNQANYTVLNRVVPANPARPISLDGLINSYADNGMGGTVQGGSIWFYSPGGILVGGTALFNIGSLLLTTGDPSTGGANPAINPGGSTRPTSKAVRPAIMSRWSRRSSSSRAPSRSTARRPM